METNLTYIYPHTRVRSIISILRTTQHHAYPVVTENHPARNLRGSAAPNDTDTTIASRNQLYKVGFFLLIHEFIDIESVRLRNLHSFSALFPN